MRDVERLIRWAGRRPEASETGRARARAAVHDVWTEVVARRRRRWWMAVAVPAVAAAVIIVAVMVRDRALVPVAPVVVGTMAGADVLAGEVFATDAGRPVVVKLAGGGELRVNAGTTVRLTGIRQVALDRGQVYLDAGGPGLSPLSVTTPAGVVRDIGTRFDVLVDGPVVRVRVRDGLVRLTAGDRDTDASAGQQILTRPGGAPLVSATTIFGADWDWVVNAAPFQADGARLDAFLDWVETEGGVEVRFADPRLRDRVKGTVLNGSIAHLGLEDALRVILPACGLTHQLVDGRVVITRSGGQR